MLLFKGCAGHCSSKGLSIHQPTTCYYKALFDYFSYKALQHTVVPFINARHTKASAAETVVTLVRNSCPKDLLSRRNQAEGTP